MPDAAAYFLLRAYVRACMHMQRSKHAAHARVTCSELSW